MDNSFFIRISNIFLYLLVFRNTLRILRRKINGKVISNGRTVTDETVESSRILWDRSNEGLRFTVPEDLSTVEERVWVVLLLMSVISTLGPK